MPCASASILLHELNFAHANTKTGLPNWSDEMGNELIAVVVVSVEYSCDSDTTNGDDPIRSAPKIMELAEVCDGWGGDRIRKCVAYFWGWFYGISFYSVICIGQNRIFFYLTNSKCYKVIAFDIRHRHR